MEINEKLLRLMIEDVITEMQQDEQSALFTDADPTAIKSINTSGSSEAPTIVSTFLTDMGEASVGHFRGEIIIAVGPAFGLALTESILGIPHRQILREIMSGIEEEGMSTQVVRVYKSSDVSHIAVEGGWFSDSGICIGLQSTGAAVIHQRDLPPQSHLDHFPYPWLLIPTTYRNIGKNAVKYARGESPAPVSVLNDQRVQQHYQLKVGEVQAKESSCVVVGKNARELHITMK